MCAACWATAATAATGATGARAWLAARRPSWLTDRGLRRITAAMIFAAVVAYYTRSTLRTLGAGMAALWLLQALSGAR